MPRNVLFIDDDEGLRRLVSRTLERDGIRVVSAPDGESGLKALAAEEFDVIALDQNMPGLDGLTTLARIHAIANHPPVIFVTGVQDSKLIVTALKAGAFDYVVKDAQGEFMPLLKATFQSAVDGMRLRRGKEAAEARVRANSARGLHVAAHISELFRSFVTPARNCRSSSVADGHPNGRPTQNSVYKYGGIPVPPERHGAGGSSSAEAPRQFGGRVRGTKTRLVYILHPSGGGLRQVRWTTRPGLESNGG